MAVHSFASIGEIQRATSDEEKQAVSDKVLTESRTFDTELRKAVTKRDAAERKAALLELEKLYEFKRSHPTVEVSLSFNLLAVHTTMMNHRLLTLCLAFDSSSRSGWGGGGC
jgi:hypothetical protein